MSSKYYFKEVHKIIAAKATATGQDSGGVQIASAIQITLDNGEVKTLTGLEFEKYVALEMGKKFNQAESDKRHRPFTADELMTVVERGHDV